MKTPTTPIQAIQWSFILCGGLLVIALIAFFSTRHINTRTARITTELMQRQTDQNAAAQAAIRIKQHGTVADNLKPLLPDETNQPRFYQMLETLASQNNVSIQYNVGRLNEQDPAILEALSAPNQWVIPVDFLGERAAVERVFHEIEIGSYILNVHAYQFDISDPSATQLSTILILYGRTSP